MSLQDQPDHYATHGALTDPEAERAAFQGLPTDVAGLCRVVQGLLVHDHFGLHLYGPPPAAFHRASRQTLPVSQRLSAILAADGEPLSVARRPFERAVGTCRDFALMLCAMHRQQGRSARVRCGFARYLKASPYEDHWICEVWSAAEQRWTIADAQLDEAHRSHLDIDFDPSNLPKDQFISPWQAWKRCRSGAADPADFGHGSDRGAWFIGVNLVRDLLSLTKRETSAWDSWRDGRISQRSLQDEAILNYGRIAAIAETVQGLLPPDLRDSGLEGFLSHPPWQG
jgi:hypothetical protein